MSDTPRTDALFPSQRTAKDRTAVWVEIGWIRDLERELNASKARIAELEGELAKLNDPVAVHINMLRGTIATPNREQMQHVWGGDGLPTPLPRPDKPGWWWVWSNNATPPRWLPIDVMWPGNRYLDGQWLPATPPPAPKNEEGQG